MGAIADNKGRELAKILHHYGLLESSSKYKIVCPFHKDINPSMNLDLIEGSFYCFGCNVTGSAPDFVRLMYPQYNDLQSLFKFYEILKSDKVLGFKYSDRVAQPKESDEALEDEAFDYYYGLKAVNWTRNESPEKAYMKARGFDHKALNLCAAKLTIVNDAYPIIFPMLDMGEFKGWVCRTTSPAIEKKRKYLYNKGFSRATTLVGQYDSKVVMVVEGYMDWLKMRQFGVKKVVAILGWKMSSHQIQKLKMMGVKTIISALDTDSCGNKGSEFLKQHFEVIRFQFPDNVKDPGDMDLTQFKIANTKTKKLYRRTLSDEKRRTNIGNKNPSKEVRKFKR